MYKNMYLFIHVQKICSQKGRNRSVPGTDGYSIMVRNCNWTNIAARIPCFTVYMLYKLSSSQRKSKQIETQYAGTR